MPLYLEVVPIVFIHLEALIVVQHRQQLILGELAQAGNVLDRPARPMHPNGTIN